MRTVAYSSTRSTLTGSDRRVERGPVATRSSSWPVRVATRIALVFAVLALIASRRPDALSNPQFWAEDGTFWFAAAYNDGPLVALLTPAGGYFQSFARLTAAASLPFGLGHAPLFFNVAAILAQALPVLYVLSSRLAGAIPDVRLRVLAALLLVGLPNSFEVQSNVTNTQTHLALLGFLIVVADAPRRRAWAAFDLIFLALGGLSGPTFVFLVPVAVAAWWRERTRWRVLVVAVVLAVAAVQTVTFLTTAQATRWSTPLGPSVRRLLGIVGGHVVVAGTLGSALHAGMFRALPPEPPVLVPLLGFAAVLIVARALFVTSSFALRAMIVFASFVLGAALTSPALAASPRWQYLQWPNVGIRYWTIPTVAFLAVLLWSAVADRAAGLRWLARAWLLALAVVGMPRDWRVPPRPDLRFEEHVQRFARAPSGRLVRIPIPPEGWEMVLRKR
jgi:hypothetical protein